MKRFIYTAASFLPTLAFAQQRADLSGIGNLVSQIGRIIAQIIPIVFAIAIIYFFWGVATYIRSAGDPKNQEAGRSMMIYGIIGIAVMASVYGLVGWLQGTLGVNPGGTVVLPTVPGLGQ
jgi:hypothetical protein